MVCYQDSGRMTPSAPTSNSLPRHVTWEVKKLRHHTQQISKSRAGRSQRSDTGARSSCNRCTKCSTSRASTVIPNSTHAVIDSGDSAAAAQVPKTAKGKLKVKNINRK